MVALHKQFSGRLFLDSRARAACLKAVSPHEEGLDSRSMKVSAVTDNTTPMQTPFRLLDLDDKVLTHVLAFLSPTPRTLLLIADEQCPLVTVASTCRRLRRVVYQSVVQHCVIQPCAWVPTAARAPQAEHQQCSSGQWHTPPVAATPPRPSQCCDSCSHCAVALCGATSSPRHCALIPLTLHTRSHRCNAIQHSQSELMAAIQQACWLPQLQVLDIVGVELKPWLPALRRCSALTALAFSMHVPQMHFPDADLPHVAVMHLSLPSSFAVKVWLSHTSASLVTVSPVWWPGLMC